MPRQNLNSLPISSGVLRPKVFSLYMFGHAGFHGAVGDRIYSAHYYAMFASRRVLESKYSTQMHQFTRCLVIIRRDKHRHRFFHPNPPSTGDTTSPIEKA